MSLLIECFVVIQLY